MGFNSGFKGLKVPSMKLVNNTVFKSDRFCTLQHDISLDTKYRVTSHKSRNFNKNLGVKIPDLANGKKVHKGVVLFLKLLQLVCG